MREGSGGGSGGYLCTSRAQEKPGKELRENRSAAKPPPGLRVWCVCEGGGREKERERWQVARARGDRFLIPKIKN